MKALIFAAGVGSRLASETHNKPKALVKIGSKTLLQIVIEKLAAFGISEMVVNVHHYPNKIIRFLEQHNNFGVHITISDERKKLLETGGGLKKAAPLLAGNEPILIHNVDILHDINFQHIVDFHTRSKSLATIAVRKRETQRYFLFNEEMELAGWKNKQTGEVKLCDKNDKNTLTELAFSGVHIIDPSIFKYISQTGKFSIVDVYLQLAKTHKISGFYDTSELWMDVGKPDQLTKAIQLFGGK